MIPLKRGISGIVETNKNRLTDTNGNLVTVRGEEAGGLGENGEGIKKRKLKKKKGSSLNPPTSSHLGKFFKNKVGV